MIKYSKIFLTQTKWLRSKVWNSSSSVAVVVAVNDDEVVIEVVGLSVALPESIKELSSAESDDTEETSCCTVN